MKGKGKGNPIKKSKRPGGFKKGPRRVYRGGSQY